MRRNYFIIILLAVVVVAAVIAVALRMNSGNPGSIITGNTSGRLANDLGKPKPVSTDFQGCPPSGDGGDPALNTLKNRIDEGQWQPTTVAALLALDWPKSIEYQSRARWSTSDAEQIAQHEGTPVQVEGYLVSAKKMSPETCNCHSVAYVDFHVWMVDDPNKDRDQSVVVEVSPRVRSYHNEWTLKRIQDAASRHDKVRISGWLLMDPEHPDQIGKTRGTIWEIHPIMQIETMSGGSWRPLDNGSTGVSAGPAVAQTIPPVTPGHVATMPPASDRQVQDNATVQIMGVHADGTGSIEPDEYVEIKNTGSEPVDITDWVLQDATGKDLYKWENYTMQPGAAIRVYTNETHPESGGFNLHSGRPVWNNSGDIAELYDVDKQLISRYAYGNKK